MITRLRDARALNCARMVRSLVPIGLLAIVTTPSVASAQPDGRDRRGERLIVEAHGVRLGKVVAEAEMIRRGFERLPGPTIHPHSPHPSWRKRQGEFELRVEPNTVGEVPAIIGIWAKRQFGGGARKSLGSCLAARDATAAQLRRRHRRLTFIDRNGRDTLDDLVREAATPNIVLSFVTLAERTQRVGDRRESVGREITVGCRLSDDRQSTSLSIGYSVGLEERGRLSELTR